MQASDAPLDLAIVGAGIAGVASLHYARRAGLAAAVFDGADGVGGLWRKLPAWQDIQISPVDWALDGLPVAGPEQPHILANIQAWVDRFGLADGIRLRTPVAQARHDGTGWVLRTPQGSVRARHLVAATGAHNTPVIPPVQRRDGSVTELHSSALRDAATLAGQSVLVVGGGASAFDLLDLCIAHGARRAAWVHRGVRWFMPTRKPKAVAGSVRGFARLQHSGLSHQGQSESIHGEMVSRYRKFGLDALLPARPFDVLQDQLFPGRFRMLEQFAHIERHPGTVQAVEQGGATLHGGQRVDDIDLLLWATGYAVDLSWIDHPAIAAVRSLDQLAARCGGAVRSLDLPDLYIPGLGLDGIGSGPWNFALLARSIASHIRGTAQLTLEPVTHNINHFDLVRYLAARDPASYPPGWEAQYRALALDTPDDQPYPVP